MFQRLLWGWHTHTKIYSTCSCSHIRTHTQTSPCTPWELHRWCLIWGLRSTSKGHLWHLRLLTNDDAQRSFATTKAEQKNWHEREVNKHKTFNKTFFLLNSLQRFSLLFFFPSLTRHNKKKKNCWVTWLNEKSGNNLVIYCQDGPALVGLENWSG